MTMEGTRVRPQLAIGRVLVGLLHHRQLRAPDQEHGPHHLRPSPLPLTRVPINFAYFAISLIRQVDTMDLGTMLPYGALITHIAEHFMIS
ncbi:hypothetical protein SLA2020_264960 [Shorea laevis]